MDRQEGLKRLREPFPKEQIEVKPVPVSKDKRKGWCNVGACNYPNCRGGHPLPIQTHLDYIGHAQITARLLDADPEYGYDILADDTGKPRIINHEDGSWGMWLDLHVLGITHRGYGTVGKPTSFRMHADLVKELIGDAIRNAAMRFGVALELWAKVPLERHDDEPETKPEGGSKGPDLDDTGAFDTEGVLKYAGVPCPDATNWTWGTVKQTKVGGKSTYKAYTWGQMWQDEAQRTWMNERLADAQAKTAKQERVVPALQRAVFAYQHLVSDAMREADKIEAAKAFKEGTKPGGDPQATAAGLDFNKTGDGSATEAMRDH